MNPAEIIAPYVERLEQSLSGDFGAAGDNLAALAESIAVELPDDLRHLLLKVTEAHALSTYATKPDAAVTFAFDCGRLLEGLDRYRKTLASDDLIFVDTDGRPVTDPEGADFDRLSRFMIMRDRLLRKAADFSLKLLVTAVAILVLGFVLGLV